MSKGRTGSSERLLTAEVARLLWSYDPRTGAFTNRVRRHHKAPVGAEAGSYNNFGNRQVTYKGKMFMVARVIFLMQEGRWPRGLVRFRDGDATNLKWSNLRSSGEASD